MTNLSIEKTIMNWYDKYSNAIFKYIVTIVRDAHQAEDIVQDTFLKAYRYIAADYAVEHPRAFLYRIAHNLALDYLKRRKPIQMFKDTLAQLKDKKLPVESIVEMNEESKEIVEALQRLKTSYRTVIVLRKVEGYSIEETASILNWSESKVKSTMFRAIRKLEKELEEGGIMLNDFS